MTTNQYTKPFIKKFMDNECYYIFDVNTNQVVEVEPQVYDLVDTDTISTMDKYNEQQIKAARDEIEKGKTDYGLFSTFRPDKVTMGILSAQGIIDIHKKGLNQLVLELTKECNLNCSYCETSGNYFSPSGNANLNMSWQECQKALDFFCEKATTSKSPVISFYGGEPLLKFDMIKQAVN